MIEMQNTPEIIIKENCNFINCFFKSLTSNDYTLILNIITTVITIVNFQKKNTFLIDNNLLLA
jgi:hypothetical protein